MRLATVVLVVLAVADTRTQVDALPSPSPRPPPPPPRPSPIAIWRCYSTLLDKHPLRTQMAASALIWGAGDVCAQRLELAREERSLRASKGGSGSRSGGAGLQPRDVGAAAAAGAEEGTRERGRLRYQRGVGAAAAAGAEEGARERGRLRYQRAALQMAYASCIWTPIAATW